MNDVRQNNDHPKIGVSDATLTWQNRNRSVVKAVRAPSSRPANFPCVATPAGRRFLFCGILFQVQKKTGALRRLKNRQWYSVNTGIKFSTDKADTATTRNAWCENPTQKIYAKRNLTALSFAQNGLFIPFDTAVNRNGVGAASPVNFLPEFPPIKP
ncbi:hypothetical protein [Marinimicrobium koreense]|uniref:hypothetical protein n=1 Tax=Marinimicrobium koreense TaxID=306545 RepID=UPI000F4CBA73|nr:hypothetical protein [Marinimicrobium koreense]